MQTDKPLVRCSLPVSSAVKVFQPYKASSSNGTARVRCFLHPRPATFHRGLPPSSDRSPTYPHPDPEHVRVTLLRGFHGDQEVCSTILHLPERRDTELEEEQVNHVQIPLKTQHYNCNLHLHSNCYNVFILALI